jgi:hypothetical protein
MSYSNLETATFYDFAKLAHQSIPRGLVLYFILNTKTTGCYRIRIESNQDFIMTPIDTPLHDAKYIYKYINEVLVKERASHYYIMFSGHGYTYYMKQQWKNEDSHRLFLDDISRSFKRIEPAITFDLICFDACMMGSVETLYELAPYTRYIIAFESFGPMEGVLSKRMFGGWGQRSAVAQYKHMIDVCIDINIKDKTKGEMLLGLYDTRYIRQLIDTYIATPKKDCNTVSKSYGVNSDTHMKDMYALVDAGDGTNIVKKQFSKLFGKVVIYKRSNKSMNKRTLYGLGIGCYDHYSTKYKELQFYKNYIKNR